MSYGGLLSTVIYWKEHQQFLHLGISNMVVVVDDAHTKLYDLYAVVYILVFVNRKLYRSGFVSVAVVRGKLTQIANLEINEMGNNHSIFEGKICQLN